MSCGCSLCTQGCNGQGTCQCGGVQPNNVPYYNCGTPLQETHCQSVVIPQYVTALSSSNDFISPAAGDTAVIVFPGLTVLQIGIYLYCVDWGYLKVIEFDPATGTVTVENEGHAKNPAPGNLIRRCTLFNVVDVPVW